jgi:Cu+-exporting ATPase
VDEATLTGEPLLVPKSEGDEVSAGTGVFEGPLTVRATTAGDGRAVQADSGSKAFGYGTWKLN